MIEHIDPAALADFAKILRSDAEGCRKLARDLIAPVDPPPTVSQTLIIFFCTRLSGDLATLATLIEEEQAPAGIEDRAELLRILSGIEIPDDER